MTIENEIEALIKKSFPGLLAMEVYEEADFARVEVDLPGGSEFFRIVRGKFETPFHALSKLLASLQDELDPVPAAERSMVAGFLKHPVDCLVSNDHPASMDPEHWCVGPAIRSRDSQLVDEVNADALEAAIHERGDLECSVHRFSHWCVGWVEHLSFRVLGDDGKPTPTYYFIKEWFNRLEDEYIADEDELLAREYEAALEAIRDGGWHFVRADAPDDWPEKVYEWLAENIPESLDNADGHGASPGETGLAKAIKDLGFHQPGEDEAEETAVSGAG